MIGDLTVGNVDAVAGLSVDISRSKLESISDSILQMLRWCRFLQSLPDGVETMYDLSDPADDMIFPAIQCLLLLTHALESIGTAAKDLVLCLRSY